MKQHVTDPEECIQCSACEMACPQHAIENIAGRFCIDSQRCKLCGNCIAECPTGAVDCFIEVEAPASVEEQATWTSLSVPKAKSSELQ